ncbi:MAG: hypothetical protein AAGI53_09170 [Planctomycetota bacterium]
MLCDKFARSIRLLELEPEDRPDQFYYLVELGGSKLALGDRSGLEPLTKAALLVESGKEAATSASSMLQLLLEQLLAADHLPEGFPWTFDRIERLASEEFADSIPLVWQRARRRFLASQHAEAARLLERIGTLAREGSYNKACSFNPAIIYADAALNLAVCYAHLGKLDDAIELFETLVGHPVRGEAARANLASLRRLRDES